MDSRGKAGPPCTESESGSFKGTGQVSPVSNVYSPVGGHSPANEEEATETKTALLR